MKRILLLLFSLITTAAIGQYPINQILSSDSTMVSVGRNATGGIRGGLVNMVFADTTAANLSRISYYTGAQIWTTTDSAIWVRFKGTPSFWVKMAGASGGTTGSFWNITGNYFGGGVPLNYGVGTNSYDYLPLKTNNITRLLIPPDGILRSSAPANKYLMMDTTTLEMYYGDGGGGSGWSLTGNAGTTSSNFIGTTDDQPLSFRVNNRWAGRLTTSGNIFWGDSAGVNNIGYSNVAIGRGALRNDVGGINLVAIGDSALYNNLGDVGAEEGLQNTAVGSKALYSNTTGSNNTANGLQSLYSNTTGGYNTANGYQSLYSNTTGSYNTANGTYSLYSNTTGYSNTANGYYSLYSNTTGYYNTANGLQSLYKNTTGFSNIANGYRSLYNNTTGYSNTANGNQSLYSNTTGNSNTVNGYYSLFSNTTGGSNTANGANSLPFNTTGSNNTANGTYSLYSNTTGDNNVGIGYQSGSHTNQKTDAKNQILIGANTYGTRDSIAVIGASFMKETILRGNLIDSTLSAGAGTKAVRWNSSTGEFTYADTTVGGGGGGWSLTGNAGTNPASNFIGTTDGQPLMFRYNNQNAGSIGKEGMHTYLGIEAGENDVSGGDPNIGIGSYVLSSNTTGDGNSAVGGFVLGINTTGYYNSAVGVSALYSNTTGYYNSAVGVSALYSNTTGYYNSAVGASALGSNTTGYYNSAVGASAGYNAKQKPDAKYQNLFGANTYGTRDSITVIGANFIKETIVRGKLIDSTLSAGAGTKAVRWNSSTGEFTYADTTVGATPAGSNKQVQYNNSGAFGGAAGVEIGNTNERLTVTSQATSEAALTVKQVGQYVGINIKPSDASNPHSPLLSFSQTINSVSAKMGLDGGVFRIEGGFNPYGFQNQQEVAFGSFYSGLANFRVHTYVADVPASPDDWTIRVRTPKTAAVGQVIDWGAAGQTGDLLQFRNNSNTVMARFDSIGKLGVNTVPVSYVDANGSLGAAITTTSSNITLDATHHTVIITSGTPTITLPAAASSNARRIYVVVNQTGSAVTISSYQNFSGSGTTTVAANSSIQIQSDGSNWYRIL